MGLICNCVGNKPISSWAQNVPCPLVYHVSLNFLIHIAHCLFTHHHNLTFHYLSYANHTPPTDPPYYFNKPPTTHHPLVHPTNPPSLLCKYGAFFLAAFLLKTQHNTFPIPLNNAHVGPFPPSIMLTHVIAHD